MAIKGSNDVFIPKNPVNVAFRPLKGVHRELPGELLPPGTFYDVKNLEATTRGLKRRGGFLDFAGGAQVDSNSTPILDLVPVWKSSGEQYAIALTKHYVYNVVQSNMTPVYWTFSTGVVKSAGGTKVTFSGTTVPRFTTATYLTAGDMFVLSSHSPISITAFPTTSTITLASTIGGTHSAGAARIPYVIRRAFHVGDDTLLDATAIDAKAVIVDRKRRGMYAYNGVTLGQYSPAMASQGYAPGCVVYFKDRLWVGNLMEPNTASKRQRIRWSSVTGNPRTFTSTDWLDLPYQPGLLRRLIPLGNLLVAYFEDAIWYGVPTNIVDLPYKFDQVETGGIGLVGPRAVCSFLGGHFFVGQDNIYFLPSDPRQGPVPIGNAIAEDVVSACTDKRRVYVVADPNNRRILFGFPMTSPTTIDKIWAYDYMSKEWTWLQHSVTMLANPLIQLAGLKWNSFPASVDWDDIDATYSSWDDTKGGNTASSRDVYAGWYMNLHKLGTGNKDADNRNIPVLLETGDIDLDQPDEDKTYTRLALKLLDFPSTALTFTVNASDDGGHTWSALGDIVIPSDQREGSVDFAFTSSTCRFRLVESTICNPYTIIEMTVRVRLRGRETHND